MTFQVLERVLDECGYDLNAAIKSLHELSLGYVGGNSVSAEESNTKVEKGIHLLLMDRWRWRGLG